MKITASNPQSSRAPGSTGMKWRVRIEFTPNWFERVFLRLEPRTRIAYGHHATFFYTDDKSRVPLNREWNEINRCIEAKELE